MTTNPDLIAALAERQAELDLTDHAMARRLGISRSMYGLIIRGERQPGPKALRGIARAFPELWPQLIVFLAFVPGPVRDRD
jgi:transcriptional regulator with XRE-family HTH domain